MEHFITQSDISKQILKSAKLSSNLPVNTLIVGEDGVGKKILSKEILPQATIFDALEFETLLNKKMITTDQYTTLILYHIDKVLNIEEFLENIKHIKIVATAYEKSNRFNSSFAIKIEIPPLSQRKEDCDELKKIYINKAAKVFNIVDPIDEKDLEFDLSKNGISLQNSIYKSILRESITTNDLQDLLQSFFIEQLNGGKNYKDLLEVFEIPLLKASKQLFKSQVQMANKLEINRITLRKKLEIYEGEI